ncbi:hypothetical protein [Pseudacidovorax intermedius]|uniref:hypothetical protein n=1 Tax=Pseudacidovorax intermedius TaxID=433924 RepID=UPI0005C29670|nr:hypothetical protein [Pseudacidovorax intermedius]
MTAGQISDGAQELDAPVPQPLHPVTEARLGLLMRRGFDEGAAIDLAHRLAARDGDLDDRRLCVECSRLQRDGVCFAARMQWMPGVSQFLTPLPTTFQRCSFFDSALKA